MKCQDIKKLISPYVEGALSSEEKAEVDAHAGHCEGCKEELRLLQSTWDLLGEADTVEPKPDYVSRFWTNVAAERSFSEKALDAIKGIFANRKLVYAVSTACVALLVFGGVNYYREISFEKNIASLSDDDLDAIEHMELASNFDMIENLDLIETLQSVEQYDSKGI